MAPLKDHHSHCRKIIWNILEFIEDLIAQCLIFKNLTVFLSYFWMPHIFCLSAHLVQFVLFCTSLELSLELQFSSVAQLCPTLCDPMKCSTLGFPVHHQLSELAQTHVHWVRDAIQPSHPLSPSPPAFSLSQHQGLLQWLSSLRQLAKVLELQLQHQSFQWIVRTDFL